MAPAPPLGLGGRVRGMSAAAPALRLDRQGSPPALHAHQAPSGRFQRRPVLHLPLISVADLLGYSAAALVFLAFSLRSITALRAMAIASNLMFIAYGWFAGLGPVLMLHLALLPMNAWRLWQCLRAVPAPAWRRRARPAPHPSSQET